jgi:hypothetical protein
MLKPCEHCGAENPALAKFCRQCGQPWPPPALRSATRDSPLMQQWRRLRHQMTRKEVRALLGEPARIEPATPGSPVRERWTYEYERSDGAADRLGGHIEFAMPDGVVAAWVEPDWRALSEPA